MVKRIYIREEYCMGCRLCEVHCLVQHSKSKDIIKVYKGKEPKPVPGIIVEEKGYLSFALQCRHCEEAPCLEACPTGAMYRDKETGAVLCDEEKCIGCWMCIMVCPFGVVSRWQETADGGRTKIVSKCDLCIGEETPVCVKNCPNEAITCEEIE
jgi:carbon-monoxide dehydrogenase iron sulfur subunit